jgi:AcrR family transcriptional regulator
MPTKTTPSKSKRRPLSRERVLAAALRMADRSGIESLSMRKLADRLGVEAMSLYKHVTSKDEVLDGLADLVVSQIVVPPAGSPWKRAMRERAVSARLVFRRHPWAAALFESRSNASPIRLGYADAVLGILRRDGFSVPMAYRAFLLLDSYVYGFTLQELNWPNPESAQPQALEQLKASLPSESYPNLVEAMTHVMAAMGAPRAASIHDLEFEYGLDVILDSLQRLRGRG